MRKNAPKHSLPPEATGLERLASRDDHFFFAGHHLLDTIEQCVSAFLGIS